LKGQRSLFITKRTKTAGPSLYSEVLAHKRMAEAPAEQI
jgi:hypothetical protein